MKQNILKLITLLNSFLIFAQAPAIEWQNRIGGGNLNYSYNSQKTNDGGLIVGGRSNSDISGDKTENSRGGYDYWVVKTNNSGMIEWNKTVGGACPNGWEQDFFYCIKQTIDGGYILGGTSNSPISGDKTEAPINESYSDIWVVKINSNGQIEWQNVIGGGQDETIRDIIVTSDGGYIIGGASDSPISGDKTEPNIGSFDCWLLKLDSFGNILWQNTFGGSNADGINSLMLTNDGGLIAGCTSSSNISGDKTEDSRGYTDYWLVKIDISGNISWQKTIGGGNSDHLFKVIQTNDQGFFLAGYSDSPLSGEKTESSRGFYDYWVVKTDLSGNIQWQKTIGGNNQDSLFSAALCTDGGYVLAGTSISSISGDKTEPAIGGYDGWVVKISSIGDILWQKTIGGSLEDGFNSVVQANDDSYFLSGGTASPISGDITEDPIGSNDYWIVKLAPDNLSIDENELNNSLILFPNPVKNHLNIEVKTTIEVKSISIYNTLGQLLLVVPNAQSEKRIDVSNLAIGNYFVKVTTDKGISNMKFIKS